MSFLSGRYPFFHSHKDLGSLAEIMQLLGSEVVCEAAESLDKRVHIHEDIQGHDLQSLCKQYIPCLPQLTFLGFGEERIYFLLTPTIFLYVACNLILQSE